MMNIPDDVRYWLTKILGYVDVQFEDELPIIWDWLDSLDSQPTEPEQESIGDDWGTP